MIVFFPVKYFNQSKQKAVRLCKKNPLLQIFKGQISKEKPHFKSFKPGISPPLSSATQAPDSVFTEQLFSSSAHPA